MSFPTSPVDGQIYGKYIYNLAALSWEKNFEDLAYNIKVNGLITSGGATYGTGINDKNIYLEDGKHIISSNDGGGNFNIRVGHLFDTTASDHISTEDGYAGLIKFTQGTGIWNISSSSASVVAGDSVGFDNSLFTVSANGVGIGANPNTSTTYNMNLGTSIDMNNNSIDYADQYHLQDNGRGDFRLTTDAGGLPGYPTDNYPTIKTSYAYMYFSVGGSYSGHMNAAGVYTSVSSKAKKHNFLDIPFDVYTEKMAGIDVQQYEYLDEIEEGNQIYVGPYAEDMYKEFGLGSGDMLSDKDTAGVALLGVKHLLAEIEALEIRINQLEG